MGDLERINARERHTSIGLGLYMWVASGQGGRLLQGEASVVLLPFVLSFLNEHRGLRLVLPRRRTATAGIDYDRVAGIYQYVLGERKALIEINVLEYDLRSTHW